MRKREYLQQRIKNLLSCSAKGQVEMVSGFLFLIVLLILLFAGIQLEVWRAVSVELEDTLAASNLASAVINIEEYGISHRVLVTNSAEAWERYCVAVRANLDLDEQWEHAGEGIFAGPVRVVNYTIYNVDQDEVGIWQRNEAGMWSYRLDTLGNVRAPNGQLIEYTGIYSELAFPVKGFFGMTVEAHKGKLVDIVGRAPDTVQGEEDSEENASEEAGSGN